MKSKRLIKLITSILVTVLITLSGFCGYKAYSNHKYINIVKVPQIQQIEINKQFLNLQYLDEQSDKTNISVEKHLLSGEFSYQQQQGIMHVTKIRTWNTVISDKDVQNKAIEGTKDAITDIAKEFGFEKVNVKIVDSPEIVHNNEVKINQITYQK